MTTQSPRRTSSNQRPASLSPVVQASQATRLDNPILSKWIDGILILTEHGECVESNSLAQSICDRIHQDYPCSSMIPEEIWNVCQILIDSRKEFPHHLVIAESQLKLKQSHDHVRIRVRWFNYSRMADPHILVVLEDQKDSRQNLAITETIRYDLSPREADVWSLHRIGYSYQEIAAELHIAINTVKKHMKNTYAKQNLVAMIEESYIAGVAS